MDSKASKPCRTWGPFTGGELQAREEANMKDRTDSAGDWTRIRQVMINDEDLFLNGDGMPVSSEYELGQCENNGIDLNEILDSIRSIMEEPFDAKCVKSKLLAILLDECAQSSGLYTANHIRLSRLASSGTNLESLLVSCIYSNNRSSSINSLDIPRKSR